MIWELGGKMRSLLHFLAWPGTTLLLAFCVRARAAGDEVVVEEITVHDGV